MKKNILNIIFSLIIVVVGPNVYADGTEGKKVKENQKQKAVKVVDRITDKIDNELNLENWMTEVTEFNNEDKIIEGNLHLEDWMMEVFTVDYSMALEDWMMEVFKIEKTEEALELENWMLEPFDISNIENKEFQENELVLENWMLKF